MSDLETFGPTLSRSTKNNPFIVPEGYFDSLPSRIQDHCTKEQPVQWFILYRSQLSIAAGFCFLVFLAFAGYYFTKPISYFDRVDYVKMVVESGTEFDESQLYEAVMNGNKKDTVKIKVNEELIDYLLNENVDYVTLKEHLKDIKP